MMSCICGSPADGNGSLCRRCAALAVLELKAGATEQAIKASYRVMVKVWHPDRFPGDKPLQRTAEAKLKEINAAFQFLSSPYTRYNPPQSANAKPASQAPAQTQTQARPQAQTTTSQRAATDQPRAAASDPKAGSGQKQASSAYRGASADDRRATGEETPRPAQQQTPPRQAATPDQRQPAGPSFSRGARMKIVFRWVMLGVLLLLTRYIWIAFDAPEAKREEAARAAGSDQGDFWANLELPRERFSAAVKRDLRVLGFRSIDPPGVPAEPEEESRATRGQAATRLGHHAGSANSLEAKKNYPFITVGTTRDEVLEDLGNPSAASSDKLIYGRSELHFRGDSVVGWRIDPDSSPIRVKLWPRSFVDPEMTTFTGGSTKDEVLAIQGTPTALSEDEFEYGTSQVYFKNDRVIGWRNDRASIPLRLSTP